MADLEACPDRKQGAALHRQCNPMESAIGFEVCAAQRFVWKQLRPFCRGSHFFGTDFQPHSDSLNSGITGPQIATARCAAGQFIHWTTPKRPEMAIPGGWSGDSKALLAFVTRRTPAAEHWLLGILIHLRVMS
jgi:hypothetical protein